VAQPQTLAEALRHLQAGDPATALKRARRLAAAEPANARAHMVAGIALRMLANLEDSRVALGRAARLDPRDYAAAYELGLTLEALGEDAAALAQFERAAQLRPQFGAAHFAAGMQRFRASDWPGALAALAAVIALDPAHVPPAVQHAMGWALLKSGRADEARPRLEAAAAASPPSADWNVDLAQAHIEARRWEEAAHALRRALEIDPDHAKALGALGPVYVSAGAFDAAAAAFDAALARKPGDPELSMFLAQVELLRGRWARGWAGYARREHRRHYEAQFAAQGVRYRVPSLDEIAGRDVTLIGEQGLGDNLFFLRFARRLHERGARLAFVGDARLHALLSGAGLFTSFHPDSAGHDVGASIPILVADLPAVEPALASCPPSLRIAPDPRRVGEWRRKLEAAGPRPWIGATWRAGTPGDVLAHGLFKTVPVEDFMAALSPLGGTVVALQRRPQPGEIDAAARALGRAVHDGSAINDDLGDALALAALLDRHVGVSNTNMHLAAAAGKTADVLVPFPPEWRWGLSGDSPWFPGFRVHRQGPDGDWSPALAAIAR
jgi:tetratricopeptide (TPR) repeat protein